MKKITIILIVCAGLFISSCKDFLDVQPANVRAVTSIEDVRGMLGGYLYTVKDPNYNMNGTGNRYQRSWYPNAVFFPNGGVAQMFSYYENSLDLLYYTTVYVGDSRFPDQYLKGVNWSSKDTHARIWNEAYGSIGFLNKIITEVNELKNKDEEVEQQIVGEAKIQRCWNAFKLLQYFSPYNDDALGIPLNFDAEAVSTTSGSRRTQTEVYEMLISELSEVLSYTAPTDESYNVFYRKSIINALLAEIYLYKGNGPAKADDDWTNARDHAMAAMTGKYLATNSDELNTLFKAADTKADFDNPHALISFFWSGKGSTDLTMQWGYPQYDWGEYWGGVKFHPELTALFSEGDIRLDDKTYYQDNEKKCVGKYIQNGYSVREIYPMFRTAELHLIIAETYAREGDDATAKQWLDDFKNARNVNVYSSSDVLTEILNERRKEFMLEYDYRWLDMKRNNMSLTRTFVHPEEGEQTITLEVNDYRFSFFIPESTELSVNSNLEQNPGWSN